MNNIINSPVSAGYYGGLTGGGNAKKSGGSFAEAVEKEKNAAESAELAENGNETLEELSMDEYKTYIYFKISRMQRQSPQKLQRKNFVLADISDEGFAKMKSDPEYESWVLNKIKTCLNYDNTWEKRDGTNYFILSFGDEKDDLEETFWFSGEFDDLPNQKKEKERESYWDSKIRRQRRFDKIYFEKLDKRRAFEKKLYEKSVRKKIEKAKYENSRYFLRRG